MADFLEQRYSKQGLWSLFLMCALPLHVWTLILSFMDISWLTERTNLWDAIGVASYGLVFAFVESILFFLFLAALGFLVPRCWDREKRIALLFTLIVLLALWGILSQLYFLAGMTTPPQLIAWIVSFPRPLVGLYLIALTLVTPTVALPVWLVLRSERSGKALGGVIEQLSLLTMFYLLFDIAGLVIVIIRNVS